ncbi:exodeoxyribonuclease III [Stackebrandtia soli]|uniref:exodeoxyribonuclease III n=1 Tax=Stackebrandtia soli TaxID=1892856 RepID=UPI0039E7E326
MLTITTANVNGIRAAARKGFVAWLRETTADVVCLQEVRATETEIPQDVIDVPGWHRLWAPAADKGRAGVAVFSKESAIAHRVGFGSAEFDTSGRYLEVELPGVTVASLYLPSGEAETPKQEQKERFLVEFGEYLGALRKREEARGREVVVCGDWNIAHQEIDLKNWRANRKSAGFLPGERAWMSTLFGELGYVDVHRKLQPEGPGPYTWWSYRGRAFDNDTGWRIDYVVSTAGLAERAVKAQVERASSHEERWSDHAPVTVTFE